MRRMRRLAAVLLMLGMGLWGQGLRFRVECQIVNEDGSRQDQARDDLSGEILIREGMSLFRQKKQAILIRPVGRGLEKVEMDFEQRSLRRTTLPSGGDIGQRLRENFSELDGATIQVHARRLQESGHVGETGWRGFSFEWKALNVRVPHPRRADQLPDLLPPVTSEIGIQVDTWINPAIQMAGLGWERVAWGMPEIFVDELLGLLPSRQEIRDAVGGVVGLAMDTRIRLNMMGDVEYLRIRVLDVKEGPIEAKEFAIPEGFREEK